MKKKTVIILSSAVAICALGLVSSHFIDWPVSHDDASGDIAKSTRFSREKSLLIWKSFLRPTQPLRMVLWQLR